MLQAIKRAGGNSCRLIGTVEYSVGLYAFAMKHDKSAAGSAVLEV